MRASLLITAALLSGCATLAVAAPIYKWVDANGVPHFSSQPPNPDARQIRNAAPAPATPVAKPADGKPAADASQQEIDRRVQEEVAKTEKERMEYCVQMRTGVTQLRNNPRLQVEVDGQRRRLSEEERQAKIAEAQKAISETCK